jgi:NhaC family Na+:H+ antiporter
MNAKKPGLLLALLPVLFLILALAINVRIFGDSSLDGSNQLILLAAAGVTAGLAALTGVKAQTLWDGIQHNIQDSSKAILILLMVGALAGSWLISGIIPTLIVYGLDLLSPSIFLPATVVVCAVVSLATGSSWATTATVGIALMGVGQSMGFSSAMVAGAVISGAYFGDKMSPFSDTTNLAPAMAGTDLMTHIRYMTLTSGPAIVITLLAFVVLGWNGGEGNLDDLTLLTQELQGRMTISPWLMVVPAISIGLIIYKVDAIVAMGIGTMAGLFAAYFFQYDLLVELVLDRLGVDSFHGRHIYQQLFISAYGDTHITMANPLLDDLMQSGGMSGMLGTIWLIICALTFGGTLAASGFLEVITQLFLRMAHSSAGLIIATLVTCGFFNATAADQYLAIVVPGRMFRKAFEDRGLAPENLSRALEDSGTATSVLVPWNTCGAYQYATLHVSAADYAIYAFFNWLSPLINATWALIGFRIRKA